VKRAAAILGVAIAGSQAGHLLAYELRFGAAAQTVQSTGAHAYFPLAVKTVFGAAALALVGSLLLVGFARVAVRGRVEKQSAPSLLRLASILYTVQLACFVVQETVEGAPASQVLLWGLVGQMPVALAGAVALRWLLARVAPALASLPLGLEPALQLFVFAAAPALRPVPVLARATRAAVAAHATRRGPPRSF
jgi:hypothetical protein